MLGRAEAFDAVPFFWSQHYDVPINYVGHAEKWDEIAIDGDYHGAGIACCRYKGTAACSRSPRSTATLPSLQAELDDGAKPDALRILRPAAVLS